jgi:hypothetical protein
VDRKIIYFVILRVFETLWQLELILLPQRLQVTKFHKELIIKYDYKNKDKLKKLKSWKDGTLIRQMKQISMGLFLKSV